jgi:GNAT superfamily N-acetyltransferase
MSIETRRLSADEIRAHEDDLIELLRDVVDGGASVNFIAPLDVSFAAAYWEKVAGEAASGARIVLAALEHGRVIGSTQLALAMQPNGIHRAEVQKVFTHSSARRQGVASALMRAIEDEARGAKRTLLVLDTERGSAAERLYEQIGYVRVGVIPQFALNYDGSQLIDTVLFYKLLG